MAASVEKIKELLGSGLNGEVVATAVGVTPGYISQLMSDPVFNTEVINLRAQALMSATVRDTNLDSLEDTLMKRLGEKIDNDLIYKPMDLLRALAVINSAKRRGQQAQAAMTNKNTTVVNLTLPTMIVNQYKKNLMGEVVEVTDPEGKTQTLVSMPASALMQKLSEQHQGDKRYAQVRKFLPGSNSSEES